SLVTLERAYAPTAVGETSHLLDVYAERWVAARTDACRATRVRGDQSERVLDLRMRCLDRRRDELGGLVTALIAAGPDVVGRSVDAAAGLAPVDACADIAALEAQPPRPADPL